MSASGTNRLQSCVPTSWIYNADSVCRMGLSTPFHKYDHVCCVDFRFWRGATREHPRSGAVTEEQRSQNRKATQPYGRRFFLAQTSLLTPYRPLKGMRVACASFGPKIPRRKRGRIYEMGY